MQSTMTEISQFGGEIVQKERGKVATELLTQLRRLEEEEEKEKNQNPLAAELQQQKTINTRGFPGKLPSCRYDNELTESRNSASGGSSLRGEPEGWGGKQILGRGSL